MSEDSSHEDSDLKRYVIIDDVSYYELDKEAWDKNIREMILENLDGVDDSMSDDELWDAFLKHVESQQPDVESKE